MKKIAVLLVITGLITVSKVNAQTNSNEHKNVPISAMGQTFADIEKGVAKQFNLKSVRAGLFGGRFNLDIFDANLQLLNKSDRDKKSTEIGNYVKSTLEKSPSGMSILKSAREFGITHLKAPSGGGITLPSGVFDQYYCKMSDLKGK